MVNKKTKTAGLEGEEPLPGPMVGASVEGGGVGEVTGAGWELGSSGGAALGDGLGDGLGGDEVVGGSGGTVLWKHSTMVLSDSTSKKDTAL